MQLRRNENDVANSVNVEDPHQVRDSVVSLFSARYPGADFTALQRAFNDFTALFSGCYPGYLACDTLYHDMRHSLDMTLALARLIDGHDRVVGEADRLGPRRAVLGVLVALLHDSGYLRRTSEAEVDKKARELPSLLQCDAKKWETAGKPGSVAPAGRTRWSRQPFL